MEENKKRGKKKTEKSEIELLFVELCHVNKEKRDTGIKVLTDYLKKKKVPLDGHNLSYICKGLFYYYWLCYSSEEQKIAACRISKILRNIDEVDDSEEKKSVFQFLKSFLRVMSSKYDSLDLYRLNKYLFLFKVFQAEFLLFLHRYSWRSDYIKRYNKIMLQIFDDTNDVFYNHIDTFFKEFFGNQFYLKAKDQNEKVHIKNFLQLMDFFFKIICKTEKKHIVDVIRNKIFSVLLKLNVGKSMLERRICRYLGKCKNPYATKALRGFYNSFVSGRGEGGENKQKGNKDKEGGSQKTPIFVENFEATGEHNGSAPALDSASAPAGEEEQISPNERGSDLTTPGDGPTGGEKQLDDVPTCKKRSKRDRASNEFNRLREIIEEGDEGETEEDLSSDMESDIGSDMGSDIGSDVEIDMGNDMRSDPTTGKKKAPKRKREENGKPSSKKNKKEMEKKKEKKKNKGQYRNGAGDNMHNGKHASSSIDGEAKHKLKIIDFIHKRKRGFSGNIILENKGKSDLPIYSIDKSELQGGCIQKRKLKVNKLLKKKNNACSAGSGSRICQAHQCYTLLANDEGEDDLCLQLGDADRGDAATDADHKNMHIGMVKKKIVKTKVGKAKKGKKMENFAKLGKLIKLAKQGKMMRLAKQSKLVKLAKQNIMAKLAKKNKKSKMEKKTPMIGQEGKDKNKSALSKGVATDAKGKTREKRKNGTVKKTILKKGKTKSRVTKRVHFNLNKNTIEYIPRIKKKNVNSYFFLDNFRNLINVPAFL
ncbi:Uncharacterized protein PCOAH_00015920 [Plasmodium coatneyi]|uniref:Nucleolar protein Nop52 n=1 Tax=Plasmodium coatneyi TaxID=208452 RepID=A0A1B1DY44_9APIC|nr:Uncharacterized protein PCOAH_00015920 [Plasmodium coatneyi]ANQ07517.1 Uncharacterized protein PCOAH_00015920 [Plasmodium coatneyi]